MINMKEIPKNTVIHVKVVSQMFDQEFEGDFKVHRPSLDELRSVSMDMSESNNGMPYTVTHIAALMLAVFELGRVVDSAPDWWVPVLEAQDSFVIMRVYNEYSEWKRSPFRYEERRLAEAEAKQEKSETK